MLMEVEKRKASGRFSGLVATLIHRHLWQLPRKDEGAKRRSADGDNYGTQLHKPPHCLLTPGDT